MQKLILSLVLLFSFLNITAQNCILNEDAKRHCAIADGMRKAIENVDDWQLVANEYEKAVQYAPDCPDIYLNLGLCYEELGKKQLEMFDKAITYYKKYLQLSPNTEDKDEIQTLIYGIEGKKVMYKKQQEKEKESAIIGNWLRGHKSLRNFSIIKDYQNIKLLIEPLIDDDGRLILEYSQGEITMRNGIFYFSYQETYYYNSGYIGSTKISVDDFITITQWAGTFELLSDGRLKCNMSVQSEKDIDKRTGRAYEVSYNDILAFKNIYLNQEFFCERRY